jgi:tetratricopeptide (TPR) repeat protein
MLGIVVLAGIMLGRAVTQAGAELAVAKAYQQEGQLARATEHYRRALRWWFPLSPFRDEAVSGLESIAAALEDAEDRAGALLAWRSLLGGVAASRFMYSGRNPAAERAKDEIARLLALEGGAAIDANVSPEKLAADHRRLLDREAAPHPLWGTVLLLGFAVWIGSLVLVIDRGFDSTGKLLWPAARAPLSGALAGLLSFIVGLFFA